MVLVISVSGWVPAPAGNGAAHCAEEAPPKIACAKGTPAVAPDRHLGDPGLGCTVVVDPAGIVTREGEDGEAGFVSASRTRE